MKDPPVKRGDVLAGKYRVESVLGVGGMGVVVEATHLELLESRAIKLMLPEALEQTESIERFLREARASSRLTSEHVARVHDVGRLDNGAPYMVMEYLRGTDLRALLKQRGRLPPPEAVHYAVQACSALAEAHAIGIVHRDLKPANLFVTKRADGSPCIKVLDFGISKVTGAADLEMTRTQAVLGSPSYMSPEQMRSARSVDARSDVWSLGVILYRMITGELPFRAESITELVTLVQGSVPRRPSMIVADVPRELDDVVMRCLERDLARRFANVGELGEALLPFAPHEARASIERIGRVLASGAQSRDSVPGRPSSKGSVSLNGSHGDGVWANTAFGNQTVAVRKRTLVVGGLAGALAIGALVAVVMTRLNARSSGEMITAQPAAVPVAPVDSPSPRAPEPSVSSTASAPTSDATAAAAQTATVDADVHARPAPSAHVRAAARSDATAVPRPGATAAKPAAEPAKPADPPKAAHRMFGVED